MTAAGDKTSTSARSSALLARALRLVDPAPELDVFVFFGYIDQSSKNHLLKKISYHNRTKKEKVFFLKLQSI
jgi:hypothetical protein